MSYKNIKVERSKFVVKNEDGEIYETNIERAKEFLGGVVVGYFEQQDRTRVYIKKGDKLYRIKFYKDFGVVGVEEL